MLPDNLKVGSPISLPWVENNKFVVNNVISGGMGTVYQLLPVAAHLRTFALKTFQTAVDPKQFSKECETWLSVRGHPSIARALNYGDFQGRPSILSVWYPFTLREQKLSQWSKSQIYNLVIGLLDALKFLDTEFELIHQDIKPANILLADDLTPKLTDFGIVRAISTPSGPFGNKCPFGQNAK
jgi:eukaryotic-like serine/threonine-protein kinase